ncbi:stealth family protein [Brevibacterium sp. CBA3109]|uniref:Stealth family protein n=1 Tax=Brevibacterium koreense TaxID=3140787 RepID=A0AAU7UJ67_9MICO
MLSTPNQTLSIELWEELGSNVQRVDGGLHLPGTLRRRNSDHGLAVDYMEPNTWDSALRNSSRLALPAPHLRELQEPIDIVYTWVDGSDPKWRARMNNTRDKVDQGTTEPSSVSESRFTSREELKFSLRSLEYYASWVRRIFIVTDQQIPEWLNTDHPKITVVDHRDIFSDTGVLPVFNSHAIESQLHHIPGLAEHYLYLNDDCFFLRPTRPELFFTANGLSKHFRSIVPIDVEGWGPRDLPIISAAKQGRHHLLSRYGRTVTHRFKHTPHSQLRSVLETMESEEPELFARVAASPFRSPEDVSIPSSLHHFDAFARGQSVEGQIGYQFVDLSAADLELRLLRVARRTDLDVFCLNETTLREESEESVDHLVARFFNARFPVPSSFEVGFRSSKSPH